MEILTSLLSAAVIVAAALALLVLAVSRLGKTAGLAVALQVLGLVTLKFIVLAAGLGLISRQPWFRAPAAAFGIAIPLIALVLWKGLGQKTESRHG
jgi:hypothetical protein